jgi:hypothetical protein
MLPGDRRQVRVLSGGDGRKRRALTGGQTPAGQRGEETGKERQARGVNRQRTRALSSD